MSFAPELLLEFLDGDGVDCDFVVFAMSGTLFRENALVTARGRPDTPAASSFRLLRRDNGDRGRQRVAARLSQFRL